MDKKTARRKIRHSLESIKNWEQQMRACQIQAGNMFCPHQEAMSKAADRWQFVIQKEQKRIADLTKILNGKG